MWEGVQSGRVLVTKVQRSEGPVGAKKGEERSDTRSSVE